MKLFQNRIDDGGSDERFTGFVIPGDKVIDCADRSVTLVKGIPANRLVRHQCKETLRSAILRASGEHLYSWVRGDRARRSRLPRIDLNLFSGSSASSTVGELRRYTQHQLIGLVAYQEGAV